MFLTMLSRKAVIVGLWPAALLTAGGAAAKDYSLREAVARSLYEQAEAYKEERSYRQAQYAYAGVKGLASGDEQLSYLKVKAGLGLSEVKVFLGAALELAEMEREVARLEQDTSAAGQDRLARALTDRLGAFLFLGYYREAGDACDDLIRRFAQHDKADLRRLVAAALLETGGRMNRGSQSGMKDISAYEEVDQLFGDDPAPEVQELVALALYFRGMALEAGQAAAVYDELTQRFAASSSPAVRDRVAHGLNNKAGLGRKSPSSFGYEPLFSDEEKVAIYDVAIGYFGNDSSEKMQSTMELIHLNRAQSLARMGRTEQAAAACRDILSRYDPADPDSFRGSAIEAAVLLETLEKSTGQPGNGK